MQLRADAIDENRGRVKVALLIASHEYLEIAVRVHWFECFLQSLSVPALLTQTRSRRQAHSRNHFNPILNNSMKSARKLREAN